MIFPDEIKEAPADQNVKLDIAYKYIVYMKEQMEFWASNREKEITNLSARVTALEQED